MVYTLRIQEQRVYRMSLLEGLSFTSSSLRRIPVLQYLGTNFRACRTMCNRCNWITSESNLYIFFWFSNFFFFDLIVKSLLSGSVSGTFQTINYFLKEHLRRSSALDKICSICNVYAVIWSIHLKEAGKFIDTTDQTIVQHWGKLQAFINHICWNY